MSRFEVSYGEGNTEEVIPIRVLEHVIRRTEAGKHGGDGGGRRRLACRSGDGDDTRCHPREVSGGPCLQCGANVCNHHVRRSCRRRVNPIGEAINEDAGRAAVDGVRNVVVPICECRSEGNEEFADADVSRVVRKAREGARGRRPTDDPPAGCADEVVEADHWAMVAASWPPKMEGRRVAAPPAAIRRG